MKAIYSFILSFAFLCCSSLLHAQGAQEHWELQSPISGNQNYIASDYIRLDQGFKYQASPGNLFLAKIDPSLLFPPTGNEYITENGVITSNPSQGGGVGTVPGQFTISPTGAAVYTIPIECPVGIQGMQPNISIVYNSQAGNGAMGWGWNLAGISSITRCGNNFHFDNKVAETKLNLDDNLMLDGQRLIRISNGSSNFHVGEKFRTESETYADITLMLNNHTYFEVKTKDGLTLEYGATANSYYQPNPDRKSVV
jgi:hypothetical protein